MVDQESPQNKRSLVLFFLLSILPGAAHLRLGDVKKGLALLCISVAAVLTALLTGSYLIRSLMGLIYFAAGVPAALQVCQIIAGRQTIDWNARWYIVLMLLMTGFSALPLLWQSELFSNRAKIAWSIAVPLLAVAFFGMLGKYNRELEAYLRRLFSG